MGGGGCYWVDGWGNCWTYQQVVDYWANLGYDYETGQYGYPEIQQTQQIQQVVQEPAQQVQKAIEVTPEGVSLLWNDVLIIASQYWWLVLVFLVGLITLAIAGWRILGSSKWGSELFKMWGFSK